MKYLFVMIDALSQLINTPHCGHFLLHPNSSNGNHLIKFRVMDPRIKKEISFLFLCLIQAKHTCMENKSPDFTVFVVETLLTT